MITEHCGWIVLVRSLEIRHRGVVALRTLKIIKVNTLLSRASFANSDTPRAALVTDFPSDDREDIFDVPCSFCGIVLLRLSL